MKILLVGEGPHELGEEGQIGALETLVRRVVEMDFECTTDRVSSAAVRTHKGKGKGYFKRAVRWIREAQSRGYDSIILLIDRDKYKDRIGEIDQAQNYADVLLPRALGVIRRVDARGRNCTDASALYSG